MAKLKENLTWIQNLGLSSSADLPAEWAQAIHWTSQDSAWDVSNDSLTHRIVETVK